MGRQSSLHKCRKGILCDLGTIVQARHHGLHRGLFLLFKCTFLWYIFFGWRWLERLGRRGAQTHSTWARMQTHQQTFPFARRVVCRLHMDCGETIVCETYCNATMRAPHLPLVHFHVTRILPLVYRRSCLHPHSSSSWLEWVLLLSGDPVSGPGRAEKSYGYEWGHTQVVRRK